MMKKAGSMSMRLHFSCRNQMAGMKRWRRFITREPILWSRLSLFCKAPGLSCLQYMMLIPGKRQGQTADALPLLQKNVGNNIRDK